MSRFFSRSCKIVSKLFVERFALFWSSSNFEIFVISKPSTIFSLDQFFVENSSLRGDPWKLSGEDSWKLSGEDSWKLSGEDSWKLSGEDSWKLSGEDSWKLSGEDSWKKFSRALSGRVEVFCLRPTRFNTLGSILASGMIRNMSK